MKHSNEVQKSWEMPSWGWFALIAYMFAVGFAAPDDLKDWALTAGWFAFGGFCIANYKSCGRIHCMITGPGFLGIGILQLVVALGITDIPDWGIWAAFGAVMAIGFGLEARNKKACGTCYKLH